MLGELADSVVGVLAQKEDILGVCLAGSVARGDWDSDSDIDLVVVTADVLTRSELMGRLPRRLRLERLSVIPFSARRWLDEARDGSLFLHHLKLEGVVLMDREGLVRRGLELVARTGPNVRQELERQLTRLRLYRDPARLNGEHLFALSHLYAIGKAVAIARCMELGETTFVKRDAFDRLAERQPALADDVETVARLRPFYDITHEKRPQAVPFPSSGVADQIETATRSIERIASG